MSIRRQPPLRPSDERFLVVRTLVAECAAGLRTTSPTEGWHRLMTAAEGVIIVRTPTRAWSTPASSAVWVPEGVRCDLEMCAWTKLRVLYVRPKPVAALPSACCAVGVSPLLRELIERIANQPALDGRVRWHSAVYGLLLHEIRESARNPVELIWPVDPRVARIASLILQRPDDRRRLQQLCRGQGVSSRTVTRLFPRETGLTFESWRVRSRLLHATRLLAEGRKIVDVADRCGYRSASAFIVAFKSFAGTTPSEFARGRSAR